MSETSCVLVIDDDPDTRTNLCDILELDDYQVETAGSVAETFHARDWSRYFAILLDRRLPDGSSDDVLPRLKQFAPHAAVIVVTGHADLQSAILALRQGSADYLLKPVNPDALRTTLLRVAERHRLTVAKERSEAAFRTLVEAAPCLIVILRPDRSIAYFSPYAEKLTGYAAAEVLGKDYVPLFVADEALHATVQNEIERILAGTPTRGFENPLRCKDGTTRWIIWNAQRLADYEGAPAILGIGQDITDLKDAQEKMLQSERLAAIGQMMTGLAHESGNALARSQACLEMLAMDETRPDALDLIGRVQKAQDHLRVLYEEVRGYAAPLRLQRETCNLAGIWRQAWNHLSIQRQGKETSLHEQIDGLDLTCDLDPFRIEQVFRNIFENSLAACPGPVRVDVSCSKTSEDGRQIVHIAVCDNGPGLTPEQKQKIFEPFFTTKTKGTGLGMAIAKRIVEAHGGSLLIGASRPSGAEIVIKLPRNSS